MPKLFPHESLPNVQKLAGQILRCTCRVLGSDPVGEVTFTSEAVKTKSGGVGYVVKARIRTAHTEPKTGKMYRLEDLELNVSTSSITVYSYDEREAERYFAESNSAHAYRWIASNRLPEEIIAEAAKLMKSEMQNNHS